MPKSKREQLIDTAYLLFYKNGFHATGLAEILTQAGVAKGTMYQHFRGKDELIEAVLRREGEKIRTTFMQELERIPATPKERLHAIFEVLDSLWLQNNAFAGCPFIKAAGEYADSNHPIHAIAATNKQLFMEYFRELAQRAGAHDPDTLAKQLALLFEGAVILNFVAKHKDAAAQAAQAANILIETALLPPPPAMS